MKFRYSEKELKEFSDYKMLYCVVHDREDTVGLNTALRKRLDKLQNKLYKGEDLTK